MDAASRQARRGLLFGVAAFTFWGVIAGYFKWVSHIDPYEILAHRIVWSVPVVGFFVWLRAARGTAKYKRLTPKGISGLAITSLIISSNWLLFIFATTTDHILDASLGYYINPLINVLLGAAFLSEKLAPVRWFSIALAAVGVSVLVIHAGIFPWIALGLAVTFGVYGLFRKKLGYDALRGLFVETIVVLPMALGWLVYLGIRGQLVFGSNVTDSLLLMGLGLTTALPLIWFGYAALALPLSTVGILQYLAPTLQFLLAVVWFGETFTAAYAYAFGFIWVAVSVFTLQPYLASRFARPAAQIARQPDPEARR